MKHLKIHFRKKKRDCKTKAIQDIKANKILQNVPTLHKNTILTVNNVLLLRLFLSFFHE